MNSPPVFRFAPSPTGHLHLGHAYSALYGFDTARANGGRFLLRIEDIDPVRCRQEYIDQIFKDLRWLGLQWEEPVRHQSRHMNDYAKALGKLDTLGLTYPCYASRTMIRAEAERQYGANQPPRDPDGGLVYPGLYRQPSPGVSLKDIEPDTPANIRLDMAKALSLVGTSLTFQEMGSGPQGQYGEVLCQPHLWGDIVLARKDTPTSYHLSVVVDDALQGITQVSRGTDIFHATSIHRLLQTLLELPEPAYNHHSLVKDETGRRLSKSAADKSLKSLRQEGFNLEQLMALMHTYLT